MDTLISRIRKNASEEIWIALGTFGGHDLLNIRAYFRGLDGFQPTRKGVAVPVSKLNELHDALTSAIQPGAENKTVAIRKNASEEIRVNQSQYMGHMLMNIRVFFFREGDEAGQPSHKGIAFNVNLTAEVIRSVELAIKQVQNPDGMNAQQS
jgi:hypothetical protein